MPDETSIPPIEFDDEVLIRCLTGQRQRWVRAADRDLRTLDDWVRTRLDAAADRELRDPS